MVNIGVPCSAAKEQSIFPCTREDEAVAIAAGMWLCGIDVTVFMQNSGFGHCIDIITSLIKPYRILVGLNIYPGSAMPQHEIMNKIDTKLYGILHDTH